MQKFHIEKPPSVLRIRHGRKQREFRPPRVEPGVLHDDRHVGFEHRGVIGVERDRLRIGKIVESQMKRPPAPTVTRYGPTGSRSPKKMVIATCASRSPALRMHAVSWEIKARSLKALWEGM
jgi:hypothetical protein